MYQIFSRLRIKPRPEEGGVVVTFATHELSEPHARVPIEARSAFELVLESRGAVHERPLEEIREDSDRPSTMCPLVERRVGRDVLHRSVDLGEVEWRAFVVSSDSDSILFHNEPPAYYYSILALLVKLDLCIKMSQPDPVLRDPAEGD